MTEPKKPFDWSAKGPSTVGPQLQKRHYKPGTMPTLTLPGSSKHPPLKEMKK